MARSPKTAAKAQIVRNSGDVGPKCTTAFMPHYHFERALYVVGEPRSFFASNEVHPSVIQTMLRHIKSQTTARYIHAVNMKQIEAQGKDLDAIKIGTKHPEQAA